MNIGRILTGLAVSNPHLQIPGQFTDSESTDLVQNVASLNTGELHGSRKFLESSFGTTRSAKGYCRDIDKYPLIL